MQGLQCVNYNVPVFIFKPPSGLFSEEVSLLLQAIKSTPTTDLSVAADAFCGATINKLHRHRLSNWKTRTVNKLYRLFWFDQCTLLFSKCRPFVSMVCNVEEPRTNKSASLCATTTQAIAVLSDYRATVRGSQRSPQSRDVPEREKLRC